MKSHGEEQLEKVKLYPDLYNIPHSYFHRKNVKADALGKVEEIGV